MLIPIAINNFFLEPCSCVYIEAFPRNMPKLPSSPIIRVHERRIKEINSQENRGEKMISGTCEVA
jgi:hypothetical protein